MHLSGLIGTEVERWARHIARMGLEDKPEHFLKGLVAWRCRSWWEAQKMYNDLRWDTIFHVYPFKLQRWEQRFPTD